MRRLARPEVAPKTDHHLLEGLRQLHLDAPLAAADYTTAHMVKAADFHQGDRVVAEEALESELYRAHDPEVEGVAEGLPCLL